MNVPTVPATCPTPGRNNATSSAASGGGAATARGSCTVSTTATRLAEDEEPLRYSSDTLPEADPRSAPASKRLERSTVKENEDVAPGAIVTVPLWGMSQGWSEVRMPVSVASPLFVKAIVPVTAAPAGAATSTRLVIGLALTALGMNAVESSLMGI